MAEDCEMRVQGYPRGSCLVEKPDGSKGLACKTTLRFNSNTGYERLIKSVLLSRPEDYLSIYQSGCNQTCLKCHSHEFSKKVTGKWMSTLDIGQLAKEYSEHITVHESREAATSWHAHRLCKHCGSCILTGKPSAKCPHKLKPEQVVISPQGFGPARNIVAFTGGDIMCRPEFYIEATKKIKALYEDFWILLETNGYGLTPKNLDEYASGGIDSFWLDIKAFSEETYRKLCGTTNRHILESVDSIIDCGFTLEILTLYIPGLVETDEHVNIAQLIADIDPEIPITLLAFFPCYKLAAPDYRPPTPQEMCKSFVAMRERGLRNLRIGNLGVFIKQTADLEYLVNTIGQDALK
ncbi:MAG: radical SAM protein [Candidatus Thorarchaeota archaeon]|jgi:pyruvate-formate lyase-activating enzyme